MNNGVNSQIWRRPALFAALAAFWVLAALPAVPAAAHSSARDEPYDMTHDCQVGSVVDNTRECVFDTNSDGRWDWWVYDKDGDGLYDTSNLDTNFDGLADKFYFTNPYGEVSAHYDYDVDGLYDDEETWLYYTDPYRWDTDGDGYSDGIEIAEGSGPLNPYCTPNGCG